MNVSPIVHFVLSFFNHYIGKLWFHSVKLDFLYAKVWFNERKAVATRNQTAVRMFWKEWARLLMKS